MARQRILSTIGLIGLGALLGVIAVAIETNSNASMQTERSTSVTANGACSSCGSGCCAVPSNKELLSSEISE